MTLSRLSQLGLRLSALSLLVLLALDLMQVVRPSGLSAAACTATLVRPKPGTQSLLARYRDTIASQALRYDLPAELVAAVMVDHQAQQSTFRDFTDCFGSALGANLSLGLAQVRLSTAAQLDGKSWEKLSASDYREVRSRLLDPELNIAYEARELRALRDRAIRFPGMSADTLIHQPAVMALLITEYRMGRLPTASAKSRLSVAAFGTLDLLQDGTLDQFNRDVTDTRAIQSTIREYLSGVYCHSGIFNQRACDDWQRSQAVASPSHGVSLHALQVDSSC